MAALLEFPKEWTQSEQWVWDRIAAGESADLNVRDREQNSDFEDLAPRKEEGWVENRRLRVKFLQTILTQKAFADATPYGGVRILGALVDDAPLVLEYARLQRPFWLERSRILVGIKGRNLRIDGEFSLENSFVAGSIELSQADIKENLHINFGTFHGEVDLRNTSIGASLILIGSTFEKNVSLNDTTVNGSAYLRDGATFKGKVDLGGTSIGSNVEMSRSKFEGEVHLEGTSIGSALSMIGSTFEKNVSLNAVTVDGSAFLRDGATFKGEVDLRGASIGSTLSMIGSTFEKNVNLNSVTVNGGAFLRDGATFKGEVDLVGASIGSSLSMNGSTFEKKVNMNSITVNGAAFLRDGATFKGEVDFGSASIGSDVELIGSTFEGRVRLDGATVDGMALFSTGATFKGGVILVNASIGTALDFSAANISCQVDLTGCRVTGELRLGSSSHRPTRWKDSAVLVLRNTHVGALQDWWRSNSDNAWPKTLRLEGFIYDRLGGYSGEGIEANMMTRPVAGYIEWLGLDPSLSPQRYEHLAGLFRHAGDPRKANDILYEARERQRRAALSKVDDHGQAKNRNFLLALGLWLLRSTIGYGLGNRYFRVLRWIGGMTFLGALFLIIAGQHCPANWPPLFFASLDQLLPIITLDKAHDVLVFGDTSATPPVAGQPYWVLVYFYLHEIAGWALGSFIVAGLAGLTQRN